MEHKTLRAKKRWQKKTWMQVLLLKKDVWAQFGCVVEPHVSCAWQRWFVYKVHRGTGAPVCVCDGWWIDRWTIMQFELAGV